MNNIFDLINRAESLSEETALGSITPKRVGAIMADTLKYMNEAQVFADSLVHKIYSDEAAFMADTTHLSDLTGKPMKAGQLIYISDEQAYYRYDGDSNKTFIVQYTAPYYIPDFTIADILQVVETGIPLNVDYGSLMTAVHRRLPIFVKELPGYPGINSCSYLYEDYLYLRITTLNEIITIDIEYEGQIKKNNISVLALGGNGVVSVSKIGIVSQRQVWTQAADNGYDYTIDNIVRGQIPQANIDLLRANGIIFNEDSGYFECGPLRDLSYNDAMNILAKTNDFAKGNVPIGGVGLGYVSDNDYEEKYRTNVPVLPYRFNMFSQTNFAYLCWANYYIEIFNVDNRAQVNPSQFSNIFAHCYRLKKILGVISLGNASGNYTKAFFNCYSLESVKLKGIKESLDFSDSARLDNESILYMIQNADATGITITLHPTAYARAEANAEIQEAKAIKGISLAMA